MTSKNTATNKATTTKATATGKKPVATPKKENPVATPKNPVATPKKETPEVVNMSTDVFSKEMLTELNKRTKSIKDSIGKIDTSFESIAFNLHWIYAKEAYKAKGADSIVKYAADMFGYEKTTCYALIAVVDRFAKRDDNGNFLEEFDERYKGYSSSKLSLMVGLTDEQIQTALKPSMSVRDIKKYIASLKQKPLPSLPDGNRNEEGEGGEGTECGNDNYSNFMYEKKLSFMITSISDYHNQLDSIDDGIEEIYKKDPNAIVEIYYRALDPSKSES